MLAEKYREIVGKQSAILRNVAIKLQSLALPVLVVSIVIYLVIAAAGIAIFLNMNEDADDFMSPVGSVYEQRYQKYRHIFPENSTNNYQGHWLMKGLGMYVSFVMYTQDGSPIFKPITSPEAQDRMRSEIKPEYRLGMDTANRFAELIENFVSEKLPGETVVAEDNTTFVTNTTFSDLCAKHYLQPDTLYGDQCYRMDMSWFFNGENCFKGICSDLTRNKRGVAPNGIVEFPSLKSMEFKDGSSSLIVLPIAEIFGRDNINSTGLNVVPCERKYAMSQNFFDTTCYDLGEYSQNVQAVRYAYHLRYDNPEDKERAHTWMDEIMAQCGQFESLVNEEARKVDSEADYRFMCYKSTSISDGAKLAITNDIKFIVIVLLLSFIIPVVVVIRPCMRNNAAMIMLIMIGLFLLTLLATLGLGSVFGLEVIYSFIIAVLFILWSFSRFALMMIESLKGFISRSTSFKSADGSRSQSAFEWFVSYWTPVVFANGLVVGFTSLLCCTAMYKLVWATSGFISVFYLLSILTTFLMVFPVIALLLKSRADEGNCCCFGEDPENDQIDCGIIQTVKDKYSGFLREVSLLAKIGRVVIVALFAVVFFASVVYSLVAMCSSDTDPVYHGYDRRDIVLPDDNVNYMLDVLTKYYPDNGPLVQMIFDNRAVYWNKLDENSTDPCADVEGPACSFHIDMLIDGVMEHYWNATDLAWRDWFINFYISVVRGTNDDGEKSLATREDFKNKFHKDKFANPPLHSIAPDIARYFAEDDEMIAGDPYTRMYIRQKYNTHTALETKFMRDLEEAQVKLAESEYPYLQDYFPPESMEFYSNLFLYYEQNRDVLSRTFLLPTVIIGSLLLLLFLSVLVVPHPVAHLAIFANVIMLFFESFAIQIFLGTTINNFSMAFYFLIYIFAIDYTMYAVHGYLKYMVESEPGVPAPSPLPALTVIGLGLLAFLLLLVAPIYSQVGIAVRNCVFVFGIVGPLHELLFLPCLLGLLICPEKHPEEGAVSYKVENGDASANLKKNGETVA